MELVYRNAPSTEAADRACRVLFTSERLERFVADVPAQLAPILAALRAANHGNNPQRVDTLMRDCRRALQPMLQSIGLFHLDDLRTGQMLSPRKARVGEYQLESAPQLGPL